MTTSGGGGDERAEHWDAVYEARGAEQVSWYQREPTVSLALLDELNVGADGAVVDVGGGAATFVDRLIDRGFRDVTVLDVSAAALDLARTRVGAHAPVQWVCADVLTWSPPRPYQLWHDRAVFHFLVDPDERDQYLSTLREAVPRGSVILGTFALDGPDSCSGLPVARYDPDGLAALLDGFDVVDTCREVHVTPAGVEQPFTFVAARRR